MVGGRDREQRLLEHRLDAQAAIVDRLGDDRLREVAREHLGREPLRRALDDAQVHAGRALTEVGDQLGHEPPARGAHDAEAGVADLEPLQHRQIGPQRVELTPDPPCALEHDLTAVGGLGATPAADEQLRAELGLELADLLRDVRLHRGQGVGRRRERPFVGDGEHCVEMP